MDLHTIFFGWTADLTAVVFFALSVTNNCAAENVTSRADDASALVSLGMQLFADKNLSGSRRISCATCHVPKKSFTDGRVVAVGIDGFKGTRNTPSLWNVATLPNQFWDGRRNTLEEQALDHYSTGASAEDSYSLLFVTTQTTPRDSKPLLMFHQSKSHQPSLPGLLQCSSAHSSPPTHHSTVISTPANLMLYRSRHKTV